MATPSDIKVETDVETEKYEPPRATVLDMLKSVGAASGSAVIKTD